MNPQELFFQYLASGGQIIERSEMEREMLSRQAEMQANSAGTGAISFVKVGGVWEIPR